MLDNTCQSSISNSPAASNNCRRSTLLCPIALPEESNSAGLQTKANRWTALHRLAWLQSSDQFHRSPELFCRIYKTLLSVRACLSVILKLQNLFALRKISAVQLWRLCSTHVSIFMSGCVCPAFTFNLALYSTTLFVHQSLLTSYGFWTNTYREMLFLNVYVDSSSKSCALNMFLRLTLYNDLFHLLIKWSCKKKVQRTNAAWYTFSMCWTAVSLQNNTKLQERQEFAVMYEYPFLSNLLKKNELIRLYTYKKKHGSRHILSMVPSRPR